MGTHLLVRLYVKGAVRQAIQVLKPYKCNKNIGFTCNAITGRLRQEVNNHSHFLAASHNSFESIFGILILIPNECC